MRGSARLRHRPPANAEFTADHRDLADPVGAHTDENEADRAWSGDVLEALGEATGVALLGSRQRVEPLGDLVETLVAYSPGEPGYILVYS